MGKITALEIQKRDKERVNVYIDGAFAFGLNLMDAAALHKGQDLTEAEIRALQEQDAIVKAVDRAARFLSYRPRSTAEVRQNLLKKDVSPAVTEAAIARMESLGYLDDAAFARYWVANRDAFKPRSPLALRSELRQKGVPDAAIDAALADYDADDAAYRAAHKRLGRYRGTDEATFRKKLGAFLQRQGFGYEQINDVLHRLLEEINETDPDYFPQDE